MAFYIDKTSVKVSDKSAQYERLWKPGETPSSPGIYKCQRCKFEDLFNRECETVPPCSKCKEQTTTWKLLVKATDS